MTGGIMTRSVPVILCGGVGVRLWPLSRAESPKHLLKIDKNSSLLQQTVVRVRDRSRFAPPLLICQSAHLDTVKQEMTGEDIGGFLVEPEGRNTGPAIAAAALWLARHQPDAALLVLPSDHQITDMAAFAKTVALAAEMASRNFLVTLGIQPESACTHLGYIRRGVAVGDNAYRIDTFIEKPDEATARHLLSAGDVYWNSGIFMFPLPLLREELARHAPDMLAVCERAVAGTPMQGNTVHLTESFREAPALAIDYALMEQTNKGAVIPVSMGWSDMGTYQALWQAAEKDGNGNAGVSHTHKAHGNYVHAPDLQVSLAEVENLVIVQSGNRLLVTRRHAVESIKELARPEMAQPVNCMDD